VAIPPPQPARVLSIPLLPIPCIGPFTPQMCIFILAEDNSQHITLWCPECYQNVN
jgi:hypothetical protein